MRRASIAGYMLVVAGLHLAPNAACGPQPSAVGGTTAAVSAGLASLTLGAALDKLDGMVDAALAKAGNQARATAIVAGGELKGIIEKLRTTYKSMLNDTLDGLNQTLRDSVGQLEALTKEATRDLGKHVDNVVDGATKISDAINYAHVFGSRAPRMQSYGPQILKSGRSTFRVRVKGDFLNHPRNALLLSPVNGKRRRVAPVTRTNHQLLFAFDSSWLGKAASAKITSHVLEVELFRNRSHWYCLWLCSSAQRVNRSLLSVAVLPERWGSVTLQATTEATVRDRKAYTGTNCDTGSSGRRSCASRACASVPEAGWVFDVGSVRWTQTRCDKQHRCSANVTRTPNSATLSLSACGHHRHRNHMTGHITATQYRDRPVATTQAVGGIMQVNVDGSTSVTLPPNTKSFLLKFVDVSMTEHMFTGTKRTDLLEVDYNRSAQTIVVRAVVPSGRMALPD